MIAAAVAPIFVLIALGYGFKRSNWPTNDLWAPAEKLTYFVLFPALLIGNLAGAQLDGLPVGPMAGAIVASALAMTALLVLVRPALGIAGPAFSSLVQGAILPLRSGCRS